LAEGAGLAHDAGNLLAAISLYCDLLERPGMLRPEHHHYASELRQLSERGGAMLQRLLTVPLAATLAAARSSVADPAAALQELAPVFERLAAPVATVQLDVPASLPLHQRPLALTAEALERITLNLVRNAGQAIANAPPSTPGRITVALSVVGDRVRLRDRLRLAVEDNGPGMTPALAAAFLCPTPLPSGASRGFGHRIIHELASATGGELIIRVRPGLGTTFSLEWPLPPAEATGATVQPIPLTRTHGGS
jgi:signal transduction histidine kinase